jgi:hypothetical protein
MDENLQILPDKLNVMVARSIYYNNMVEAYSWHFRIKDRPATFDELIKFANWQGLENKQPSKVELIDFFLDKKISF